jgi:hypothetical protein
LALLALGSFSFYWYNVITFCSTTCIYIATAIQYFLEFTQQSHVWQCPICWGAIEPTVRTRTRSVLLLNQPVPCFFVLCGFLCVPHSCVAIFVRLSFSLSWLAFRHLFLLYFLHLTPWQELEVDHKLVRVLETASEDIEKVCVCNGVYSPLTEGAELCFDLDVTLYHCMNVLVFVFQP